MVGDASPAANSVSGGVEMQIRAARRYAHDASLWSCDIEPGGTWPKPWRRWARSDAFRAGKEGDCGSDSSSPPNGCSY